MKIESIPFIAFITAGSVVTGVAYLCGFYVIGLGFNIFSIITIADILENSILPMSLLIGFTIILITMISVIDYLSIILQSNKFFKIPIITNIDNTSQMFLGMVSGIFVMYIILDDLNLILMLAISAAVVISFIMYKMYVRVIFVKDKNKFEEIAIVIFLVIFLSFPISVLFGFQDANRLNDGKYYNYIRADIIQGRIKLNKNSKLPFIDRIGNRFLFWNSKNKSIYLIKSDDLSSMNVHHYKASSNLQEKKIKK